jgi:hypothetical protein
MSRMVRFGRLELINAVTVIPLVTDAGTAVAEHHGFMVVVVVGAGRVVVVTTFFTVVVGASVVVVVDASVVVVGSVVEVTWLLRAATSASSRAVRLSPLDPHPTDQDAACGQGGHASYDVHVAPRS